MKVYSFLYPHIPAEILTQAIEKRRFNMRTFYHITIGLLVLNFFRLYGAESVSTIDTAKHAMVVSARAEAVDAGLEMLKLGGNAVDAAAAAAFVIGVVEPYASGLGGGGGMLVYLKEDNRFHYLDYYVQAPGIIDTSFSSNRDRETVRSICIPGTPAGLVTAVQKFGRLELTRVLQPAIRIARKGFPVNETFFEAVLEKLELILKYESTTKSYLQESLPIMAGDTMRLPQLAAVLEGITEEGSDYFYRSQFTEQVVAEIAERGGNISVADFNNYQVLTGAPVSTDYRGFQIVSAAPPQSGITLLEILKMAEQIPSEGWKEFRENSDDVILLTEIIKRADADRYAFLADPRFSPVPLGGLLNPEYIRERFMEIDPAHPATEKDSGIHAGNPWDYQDPLPENEAGTREPDAPHTTHISVIDEAGNMVSLTQTLGFFFGSGFSKDGVIFNSGMTNFSRRGINRAEPGKRPRSTICPTIILKDLKPVAVLGTPGGGTIFNTMAQIIIRLIDLDNSPVEAVYAPRFSTRVTASNLTLEDRFSEKVVTELKNTGYEIKLTDPFEVYLGGVQLIWFDKGLGEFIGVSDPRRGGLAGGY